MKRKAVKRKPLVRRVKPVVVIPREEISELHKAFNEAYRRLKKWYRG